MKKVVVLWVLVLLISFSAFAVDEYMNMENPPSLDIEGAYIIDVKPLREKIRDNIAFYNLIGDERNIFDIYYVDYNTGKWIKNAKTGKIEEYEESETVSLNSGVSIKKVPFIAIIPQLFRNYNYKIYPKRNDIYIEVNCEVPKKDNAVIIDISSLPKKPKDNIKIFNKTSFTNYKFAIYGYNNLIHEWLPINKFQKKEMVKTPDSCSINFDFDEYKIKYIAVGVNNGIITKYSTEVKHKDLYLYIDDIDDKSSLTDSCDMAIQMDLSNPTEFKEIVPMGEKKKDSIFDAIMAGCVVIFNKSDYVIEYQDKNAGTIKGKFSDSYDIFNYEKITFTFDVKDSRYRIKLNCSDVPDNDNDLIFEYYPYIKNILNNMIFVIRNNIKEEEW